jgi:hypothetical protein
MKIIRNDRSRCSDLEKIWFGNDYIGVRYFENSSITFAPEHEVGMGFILSINICFKHMPVLIDPHVRADVVVYAVDAVRLHF